MLLFVFFDIQKLCILVLNHKNKGAFYANPDR